MREQIVKLALKITEHYVARSCICARSRLRSQEKMRKQADRIKLFSLQAKAKRVRDI